MQSRYQSTFEAIEKQRIALQASALALSDAQLRWKPDGKVWSIGQVIEHLVIGDETVGCAQNAKTVEAEKPMFRFLPRAARRSLVLLALRRGMALPLPDTALDPSGDRPLPELLARWKAARGEMRRILDSPQYDEMQYAHAVLGPLNAAQMLELSETHTAYHTRQIEALQRPPAFPQK